MTTQEQATEFPPAWMGYASLTGGVVTVRICGWCASKPECDAIAIKAGFAITHSMCPQCSAREIGKLMGEAT